MASPELIAEAAEEFREQQQKSRRDPKNPDPIVDEAFDEATRRETAINNLYRIVSLLQSEALALERGEDALASCHWETSRLLLIDKSSATRPLYERAFPDEARRYK